jgi:hypothetical protein
MKVLEIIKKYLIANGCDGVCFPEAHCGCGIDDLCPCGETLIDCIPARKRKATKEEAEEADCEEGDELFFPVKIEEPMKSTAGLFPRIDGMLEYLHEIVDEFACVPIPHDHDYSLDIKLLTDIRERLIEADLMEAQLKEWQKIGETVIKNPILLGQDFAEPEGATGGL